MERASFGLREVKFDAGAESTMTFKGYGAVFGNVDAYGDVISPGAFADTLAASHKTGQWPAMLLQHGGWGMGSEDMTPIGIWTELSEDGHGLISDPSQTARLAGAGGGACAVRQLLTAPGVPGW